MNDAVKGTLGTVAAIAVVGLLCVALVFGSLAGCGAIKDFHRSQTLKNARNNVQVTKIEIQNQDQQAKVVTAQNGIVAAKAQQRFIESVGIRRAQDEVAKTLTPLYIQHEAIQAEEQIAASGQNNTVVYVPSGPMGVPLVQTPPTPSPTVGVKK